VWVVVFRAQEALLLQELGIPPVDDAFTELAGTQGDFGTVSGEDEDEEEGE